MAKEDRVPPDTQEAGAAGAIPLVPATTKWPVSAILPKGRCFRVNGSMDEQLCQLMGEVLRHGDGSTEQRQAIDPLLKLIPTLPGIYRDSRWEYQDYQDALNRALEGVSVYQKKVSGHGIRQFVKKFELDLDKDEPEVVRQCFVRRFNRIIKIKIAEIYNEKGDYLSLDYPIDDGGTTLGDLLPDRTLSGLDDMVEQEERAETQRIDEELRLYIEIDPEGRLRECHPDGYPQSNCQELAKRRLLKEPPDKWKDIAQELKTPYGTVTSHWHRKCEPLLQEIARSLGYQPE